MQPTGPRSPCLLSPSRDPVKIHDFSLISHRNLSISMKNIHDLQTCLGRSGRPSPLCRPPPAGPRHPRAGVGTIAISARPRRSKISEHVSPGGDLASDGQIALLRQYIECQTPLYDNMYGMAATTAIELRIALARRTGSGGGRRRPRRRPPRSSRRTFPRTGGRAAGPAKLEGTGSMTRYSVSRPYVI